MGKMYMQEMSHKHTKELDIFFNEHEDKCTNCGKPFVDGMCAHLGYISERKPAVLCDDCSALLVETIVRYHWMKKEYEKPEPTDKLWRYMDLAKFIHLISTGKLHFASADSFDDPFEGAKGIVERKDKWDSFYLDFFRHAIRTVPGASPDMLEQSNVEKQAQRLLSEMDQNGDWSRKHTFISCWHQNEYESEAMWKLYAVNTQNAIAIQTTAAHLYYALDRNPDVHIGRVKYIDYEKRFSSINGAYWYKRKSFEHEKEVRAITMSFNTDSKGLLIPVDIKTLIDSIHVSPYAPKWFEEVVNSVVQKYEMVCPVVQSEMSMHPFF